MARVDDVGRKADGEIERVHLVELVVLSDAAQKVHQVDERVQVEIGQLEAQIENRVELGLGLGQLDRLDEARVESRGEQRVGHLAEEELDERGEIEDGERAEVEEALVRLALELLEARGGAVAPEQALHVHEVADVGDGVLQEHRHREMRDAIAAGRRRRRHSSGARHLDALAVDGDGGELELTEAGAEQASAKRAHRLMRVAVDAGSRLAAVCLVVVVVGDVVVVVAC